MYLHMFFLLNNIPIVSLHIWQVILLFVKQTSGRSSPPKGSTVSTAQQVTKYFGSGINSPQIHLLNIPTVEGFAVGGLVPTRNTENRQNVTRLTSMRQTNLEYTRSVRGPPRVQQIVFSCAYKPFAWREKGWKKVWEQ